MEKILVVDDDDAVRETLHVYLKRMRFNVITADNGEAAYKLMLKENPDLIISDIKMPKMNGLELLTKVKELNMNIPFVLITGYEDISTTIKAMQLGAYDYIEKPLDTEKFKIAVERAINSKKLSDRLEISIMEDSDGYDINNNGFLAKTSMMKEVVKKIGQVSMNKVNVLIQGESGTGKELIAKIIHYSGINKEHPFIAVNCSALSESLLESELFGHVTGSFTGAVKDKKGKFELAGEGTIFLDEISEISIELQVKLLRVIQEREFEKVGGEQSIPMKARIIAATNRNLEELVNNGKFRQDLYYRLKVFSIDVPPLRERKEAIPDLVLFLLKKINFQLHKSVNKVPFEVMEILQQYDWIGNVRELENVLLQAVVLSKGDVLEKENLLIRNNSIITEEEDFNNYSLAEMEKRHISNVLTKHKWDKNKAAKQLKISLPTLYNKISTYKLKKSN
ncbi:MAG TPA: sigma-54 dependent transcriptional regulator [Ignavibacteriaceae bacterium]|nr:sigma-54 dependent transcriptional regulator [Ignavibacteriaceae bacterium]